MWINPQTLEVSTAPGAGFEPVHEVLCPLTGRLEKAVAGAPELADGAWRQTWIIEPLTPSEVSQVEDAERVNASIPLALVTMRQARLAMLHAGILDDVESMLATMEGEEGRAARIDWEFAQDVRRDWHLVGALGSQLGMTADQIDDLFIYAGSIPQ